MVAVDTYQPTLHWDHISSWAHRLPLRVVRLNAIRVGCGLRTDGRATNENFKDGLIVDKVRPSSWPANHSAKKLGSCRDICSCFQLVVAPSDKSAASAWPYGAKAPACHIWTRHPRFGEPWASSFGCPASRIRVELTRARRRL